MSTSKGKATFRRTDRTDAPLYLARYAERRSRPASPDEEAEDDSTPLYLRRFRDRRDEVPARTRSVPLEYEGERFAPEYAAVTRSHEIIPESHRKGHEVYATCGLMLGFVLMMLLDTALG